MGYDYRDDEEETNGVYEERPYYDDKAEKEELGKVPVEYLGHLRRRKIFRLERFVFWFVFWLLILGVGPGIQGQKINARSGEIITYYTYVWGLWGYESVPKPSEWTEWYLSLNPEPHEEHWVNFGTIYPALFGHLTAPWGRDLGWIIPDNTIERMKELDERLLAGNVMKIPRVLNAVNNGREWSALIVPLCEGTVGDAVKWWEENDDRFLVWSRQVWDTPMPDALLEDSVEYIEKMRESDEYLIPLLPE